jgi:hypothetical protein
MTTISPEVRTVLERVHAAGGIEGNLLRLTAVGQLDRKLYVKVNQILTNLGGKWVGRKTMAHVWPEGTDVAAKLGLALDAGKAVDPKREEGFFATPDDLADEMVRLSGAAKYPGSGRVLEPSAGNGALVRAIRRASAGVWVTAIEPNPERAAAIEIGVGMVREITFEDFHAERAPEIEQNVLMAYDAVVMNPPFALPGNPTVWIDHVRMAWDLLAPGAVLVSIAPGGFAFRDDRKHREMRELVETHGNWTELPEETFKASGTGVSTVMLTIRKPA